VLIDEAQCREILRCEKHYFPQCIIPGIEIIDIGRRKERLGNRRSAGQAARLGSYPEAA
jgi:hypothetical protein